MSPSRFFRIIHAPLAVYSFVTSVIDFHPRDIIRRLAGQFQVARLLPRAEIEAGADFFRKFESRLRPPENPVDDRQSEGDENQEDRLRGQREEGVGLEKPVARASFPVGVAFGRSPEPFLSQ